MNYLALMDSRRNLQLKCILIKPETVPHLML